MLFVQLCPISLVMEMNKMGTGGTFIPLFHVTVLWETSSRAHRLDKPHPSLRTKGF